MKTLETRNPQANTRDRNQPFAGTFLHLGLGWIDDKIGGLERYQHGICTAHSSLGCDVTAWVQSRIPLRSDLAYKALAFASPDETRAAKIKKLRVLARQRFATGDFIFVSHHASISAAISRMARKVPHIVHFHGPWAEEAAIEGAPWWKTCLQRREERRAYHSADRIITLSIAFQKLVVEKYGVPADVVCVIPGAIDAQASDPRIKRQDARQRLGWPTDRPIVLCMRRLVRRVGVDVLLEAVDQLLRDYRKQASDVLVLLGGTGPLGKVLNQRIVDLGLQDHVRLLGFVPDELLSTAYRAADVSIVPTQSLEGFGLVTLESMAAGTPVLVTPVGSLPEVMSGLNKSLIMTGKSPTDIAEGLRACLADLSRLPDEHSCRQYVRANYDWSVIAPRVLQVYRGAGA